MIKSLICLSMTFSAGLWAQSWEAQNWEVGALGGYGFSNEMSIKTPQGSANSSLAPGGVIGFFGGEDTYNYVSGEARYLYRYSDLRLSSAGTTVDFGGHTHIVTGNFLFHFRPRESRIRPFIAVGGGISVLVGTGIESAAQPLGRFAALTATSEVLPTADVGVGVKFNLRKYLRLRLEVDDYISGRPSKVIAIAPGANASGWLNDVNAFAGISFVF